MGDGTQNVELPPKTQTPDNFIASLSPPGQIHTVLSGVVSLWLVFNLLCKMRVVFCFVFNLLWVLSTRLAFFSRCFIAFIDCACFVTTILLAALRYALARQDINSYNK